MSASAASGRSWSARRKKVADEIEAWFDFDRCRRIECPVCDFRRGISRISPTCWCRNWCGAGVTRTTTKRERCARKLFGKGARAARSTASCRAVSSGRDGEKRRKVARCRVGKGVLTPCPPSIRLRQSISNALRALVGTPALCPPYDSLRVDYFAALAMTASNRPRPPPLRSAFAPGRLKADASADFKTL